MGQLRCETLLYWSGTWTALSYSLDMHGIDRAISHSLCLSISSRYLALLLVGSEYWVSHLGDRSRNPRDYLRTKTLRGLSDLGNRTYSTSAGFDREKQVSLEYDCPNDERYFRQNRNYTKDRHRSSRDGTRDHQWNDYGIIKHAFTDDAVSSFSASSLAGNDTHSDQGQTCRSATDSTTTNRCIIDLIGSDE